VLNNHTVELGTQGKDLVLQVAWQGQVELFWLFPESSILNPESPLWGKFSCYITLQLEPNELAHLFSVISRLSSLFPVSPPPIQINLKSQHFFNLNHTFLEVISLYFHQIVFMNLDLISSKYCWTLDIIGVDCNELVHVCAFSLCLAIVLWTFLW
jgi:hypothetical protein